MLVSALPVDRPSAYPGRAAITCSKTSKQLTDLNFLVHMLGDREAGRSDYR